MTKPYKHQYNTEKSINRLINSPNSTLGKLAAVASRLEKNAAKVRSALDPNCREHCRLAGFRNGRLSLQADSSVWATRIRLQQNQLIDRLGSLPAFAGINAVKVSVLPRHYQRPDLQLKAKAISAHTADNLLECAENTEDEALKNALKKLAQMGARQRGR